MLFLVTRWSLIFVVHIKMFEINDVCSFFVFVSNVVYCTTLFIVQSGINGFSTLWHIGLTTCVMQYETKRSLMFGLAGSCIIKQIMRERVHIIVQNVERDLHQSLECMVIVNYIQAQGYPDASTVARNLRYGSVYSCST